MKKLHLSIVAVICVVFSVLNVNSSPTEFNSDSQTSRDTAGVSTIAQGPMLGRLTHNSIGVWARTAREGEFSVRYGLSADKLDKTSESVKTTLIKDNTGWVQITNLEPNTRYYYEVIGKTNKTIEELRGSFKTLPIAEQFKHPEANPKGLFNFSFEFGCGNRQGKNPELKAFKTMKDNIADDIHFAILNGDWLYEDWRWSNKRTYTVDEWREQVGLTGANPMQVDIAPAIVGVWENYKEYMKNKNLMAWHRYVPSFYMYDDHEILDNVVGTGTPGLSKHFSAKQNLELATFRDIGVSAWENYIGWSNPNKHTQKIHFGEAKLTAGSDVLVDSSADFTKMNKEEISTLLVLWKEENNDVYEVKEILGKHKLRIHPKPEKTSMSKYTIGQRSYYSMKIGNIEIFVTDTRGHRQVHDLKKPYAPGVSMLGLKQKAWLKNGMKNSTADFLFVVSTVNLMIPHVMDKVDQKNPNITWYDNKDEAWTACAKERDELIDFWDELDQPVLVLTGDLHNSIVIKVTDNVWECASGPHNSSNHYVSHEGDRPSNGHFQSHRKSCDIRWSSFFRRSIKNSTRQRPIYCVVRVNNVFRIPVKKDKGDDVWAAFENPQVIFQYYDGLNGDLLYAESIVNKKK